jgi:radical SAM superfamily enzyme YgiQ (UPF0313 family)
MMPAEALAHADAVVVGGAEGAWPRLVDDAARGRLARFYSGVRERVGRVVDTLQSRGVSVNGCFILGLDAHTPDVFAEVRDFVRASGLAEVQYTVLTPFPGTPLHARLRREGRLLAERFWDQCTLFDVTFVPKRMSVAELEARAPLAVQGDLFAPGDRGPAPELRRPAAGRAVGPARRDGPGRWGASPG